MSEQESRFPLEFKQCHDCGCPDTVSRLAWLEECRKGKISEESKDLFTSLERILMPLIDPKRGVGLTATILIAYYDVCAKCGRRYCTKAETQTGPVQVQPVKAPRFPTKPFGEFPHQGPPRSY